MRDVLAARQHRADLPQSVAGAAGSGTSRLGRYWWAPEPGARPGA